MTTFTIRWILDFFIAFGIVTGGGLLSGIGAVLLLQAPASVMENVASNIKVWAMVAAVGGTIDPLRVIETNIQEGYLSPVIKQLLLFASAFIGAQLGYSLIHWISGGGAKP
ncbi:YtrH family sporulation protein [Gorillibacterium massiliense]|uniref:YtrH family sporulation protein n=1 Tax=Gorillibacterium massiliense TaxID=1280390 RepID=UPI0004B144D6|nr:YtrH family sporulation protein [Gorillibacterium massiliense]